MRSVKVFFFSLAIVPLGAAELPRPIVEAAERALAVGGRTRGFCVDVRCGNGQLMAAIAERSELFVHGLEATDERVEEARQTLSPLGVYGDRVAVERGNPDRRLPYPDYCANLVVRGDLLADGHDDTNWPEVLRILRPGGVAVIGTHAPRPEMTEARLRATLKAAGATDVTIRTVNGLWACVRRETPRGMADWSHDLRGSGGNNPCVPDSLVRAPFHTLWMAEPLSFNKFGIPLVSGGRVLLRHGGIRGEKPKKQGDLVQAFDAYNGTQLWEKRLPMPNGHDFVAVAGAALAEAGDALVSLAAEDGRELWRRLPNEIAPGLVDWTWYAASEGVVTAALAAPAPDGGKRGRFPHVVLVGLRAADGRLLWQHRPESPFGPTAIGGRRVYYASANDRIAAVDAAGGGMHWETEAKRVTSVVFHEGHLYTNRGVYAAADGTSVRGGHARGILVGTRLFSGNFRGLTGRDLTTGKSVAMPEILQDPYCPKTGIPKGSWCYGRCVPARASTHCYVFSAGGAMVADLRTTTLFPCEQFRGNCRTGVIPACGLLYSSPSGCRCVFPVRGQVALVPVGDDFYWARPGSRPPPQLERGPAYGETVTDADTNAAWPAFRHDSGRSAVLSAPLTGPFETSWSTSLPGRLTPPALADEKVFVGSDRHACYALDARDGRLLWQYRTGGDVPVTPTYWQGRVYLGSLDGWVYCLDAGDGRLAWRFRGAPHERKFLFRGRPRSLWPIGGGVIVEDGVALFYAGYSASDRVFVWALDAVTGKTLWCNDGLGRAVDITGGEGGVSPTGVSTSGVLAASTDMLYVPHGMRTPAGLQRSDGKLRFWNWRGDSTQRSNIHVQHLGGANLALGASLLFIGGPDANTGAKQAFRAVDAETGRFWGADDARLFAKAGRDPETGNAVQVKQSLWGTYALDFGDRVAPVVAGGGIFVHRHGRVSYHALDSYLEAQFAKPTGTNAMWQTRVPGNFVLVAGDQAVCIDTGARKAHVVALNDGAPLWTGAFPGEGTILANGVAAAPDALVAVTDKGDVVCLHRQSR